MRCDSEDNHYDDYREQAWEQKHGHTAIRCHACGDICGRVIPARISGPPEDCWPEESEGKGEDFQDDDGNWHCSQKCLTETLNAKKEQEVEDE